jgi:putative ubiquitin-RnfH superfamily antitoxin RatB of RatAB toxin-antitoxin module
LKITVACAGPGGDREQGYTLADAATLADALEAARSDSVLAAAIVAAVAFGVWGRVRETTQVLREGDRVEIYRPLQADPKEARRKRAKRL